MRQTLEGVEPLAVHVSAIVQRLSVPHLGVAPLRSDCRQRCCIIAATVYAVLAQLRPHLPQADFLATIRRLEATTGFRLASVTDEGSRACHWPAFVPPNGSTPASTWRLKTWSPLRRTAQGYGSQLFDWLAQYARAQGCRQLRLVVRRGPRSGCHRFYGRKGMRFEARSTSPWTSAEACAKRSPAVPGS